MAKRPFNKYELYEKAVQSPDHEVDFLLETYQLLRGIPPKILREDFCGTHAICRDWISRRRDHFAVGVDIDPEPLDMGRKQDLVEINAEQRDRLYLVERSVLDRKIPKADIACALNFSYCIFKKEEEIEAYFKNTYRTLTANGVFILDLLGGADYQRAHTEKTRHRGFNYYWEQESFNPITFEALFYIHFKRDGEKKHLRQFVYDWRMWTIPELRYQLKKAGFSRSIVYWEGTNRKGEPSGEYYASEVGDDAPTWVAYVVGVK